MNETRLGNMRIHEARNCAGLTQIELAKAAGVSKFTIQCLESGKTGIKLSSCRKVCRALNCRLDDLFQVTLPVD